MDWLTVPDYWWSRLIVQRALAGIYLIAFAAAVNQFRALLGEHGLTPVPAFVRRTSFRHARYPAEEPPGRVSVPAGRDQHVDDLPVLVDRPVHVPPDSVDFDVGLVDVPPIAGRVPGESGRVAQQRREPLHPTGRR
jgi:hypothetical protein